MADFDQTAEWQRQPEGADSADSAPTTPPESQLAMLTRWINAPNIATELKDEQLGAIGQDVKREAELDEQSRVDWRDKIEKAIELAKQYSKPKSYPWPGASNVVYPLMTTACMQFAARAYPAIIANRAVVKGEVLGRDDGTPLIDPRTQQPVIDPQTQQPAWQVPPGALQQRADRIGAHMSWQLLDEMPEWEPETDALLHQLPIVGTLFRKTYFDPAAGRNKSLTVPALKLIVNYMAKSLELAPRVTEEMQFYPYETREFERAGLWLARTYQSTTDRGTDPDAPIEFYEQHRWLDLDGDNYPEPYVVTVDKAGAQVVRIVARYDAESVHLGPDERPDATAPMRVLRIDPLQFYTQYNFLPSLDGGIYGTGFGQLLGPINSATNTTLNLLIDAGHLDNIQGGFIAKNLSMHAGAVRWTMGEFKPVNAGGMPLRDSILPLPTKGPSNTLFTLLGTLIEAGKDVASIKDVLAGEQPQANVPATTVLALIEQGQKVFTAIFKRIHRALKLELKKLYRLNRIHLQDVVDFQVNESWLRVTRDDYVAGAGVAPVSDPTMVSDMQQLGRAQYLMQFRGDPLIRQDVLTQRLLKAASIDDIPKLMNPNPQAPPAVVAKGIELDTKKQAAKATAFLQRAQALQAITQGALNLAKADQAVGDAHLAWVDQQMQGLRLEYEMMLTATEPGQSGEGASGTSDGVGGGAGPAGPVAPRVGIVAAPPGDQGGGAVPPGPAGSAMGGIARALQGRIAGAT